MPNLKITSANAFQSDEGLYYLKLSGTNLSRYPIFVVQANVRNRGKPLMSFDFSHDPLVQDGEVFADRRATMALGGYVKGHFRLWFESYGDRLNLEIIFESGGTNSQRFSTMLSLASNTERLSKRLSEYDESKFQYSFDPRTQITRRLKRKSEVFVGPIE